VHIAHIALLHLCCALAATCGTCVWVAQQNAGMARLSRIAWQCCWGRHMSPLHVVPASALSTQSACASSRDGTPAVVDGVPRVSLHVPSHMTHDTQYELSYMQMFGGGVAGSGMRMPQGAHVPCQALTTATPGVQGQIELQQLVSSCFASSLACMHCFAA
jgi:hypothetical protein